MGVRGLTTYINSNSHTFFAKYQLHDCVLVVDGNSLAAVLYSENLGPYSAFGGDYNILAEHVANFIKNLRTCRVEPVFIFDGGYERKKALTVRKRNAMKVFAIEKVSPDKSSRDFFPYMLRPVLQERLIKLGVVCLQSDYEADREIAALAKRLNAPVLSNDSDFFIYNVPFIPLSRFSFDIFHQVSSDSKNTFHYMACDIYYVENFLKTFGGLQKDMLPLLATVLGNDYINRSIFKNLFGLIKLDKSKKVTLGQRRVGGLVQWLKKETYDSAYNKILASLPKLRRHKVKSDIASIISTYSNLSTCFDKCLPNMIVDHRTDEIISELPLELNKLKIADQKEPLNRRISSENENKFEEENEEDLEVVEDSSVEDNEDDEEDEEALISSVTSEDNKVEIPEWLLERSRLCQIPPQVLTLFSLRTYFCVPQVEDCSLPHAGQIGLPILRIISGIILNTDSFSYWFRHGNNSYKSKTIEIDKKFQDLNLLSLNKMSLQKRKQILLDSLEFENELILDNFPEDWQLLIMCLFYWIKNQENLQSWHIHGVIIMAIVINIFHSKIGTFRKIKQFHKKYGSKVKRLEQMRQDINAKLSEERSTFIQKLSDIKSDDCLITFEGIIPYLNIDTTLKDRPRTFQRSVVHYFAELQVILDLTQMLNSLLLCPFDRLKVSEFYNGTFLYNMTVNFKRQPDLVSYLEKLYRKSPNLLSLHMVLYDQVIQFTSSTCYILHCVINKKRRRRKKKKSVYECSDAECLNEDSDDFHDENNKFSQLQIVKNV